MTSASSGTICTTRSITRKVVRNRKRNRATAVAAISASRPDARTVTTARIALFAKYSQKETSAMPPFSTRSKCSSVGWAGSGFGVVLKISVFGLNAVEAIQKTGKTAMAKTSRPVPFSSILRGSADFIASPLSDHDPHVEGGDDEQDEREHERDRRAHAELRIERAERLGVGVQRQVERVAVGQPGHDEQLREDLEVPDDRHDQQHHEDRLEHRVGDAPERPPRAEPSTRAASYSLPGTLFSPASTDTATNGHACHTTHTVSTV